ncbi:MAG: glycoside hydrolase family 13 protein [Rubricoccaceae bacterium]
MLALLLVAPALGCAGPREASAPGRDARVSDASSSVPMWARRAVWYQVFPERFRNGDPANDPTPESMEGAWPQVGAAALRAAGWRPTPWGHDWYAPEPWAQALGEDFWRAVQLRRYGGDLEGLRQKLPYLRALGVTALYLNPLNDAPSLHKYDARSYVHVDRHFGPDPEGDARLIAAEDPRDPSTWTWTAADRLFLDVLREARALGLRVVLDFSWNHTGTQHAAFQDVRRRGASSPFANWYRVDAFDDPATPADEFRYTGWAGVAELPELRKVDQAGHPHEGIPYEGHLDPEVAAHVFAVTRRWLDPDGDGDPSDGVDGFRLDVAEMVPLGFWRDYRAFVKQVNPEAVLIGEIWWQRWPEVMMDPRPYLGDAFDGVMDYRWFEPARRLLTGAPPGRMTPSRFAAHLDSLYAGLAPAHREALMTTAGTHDTPRLATTLFNPHARYKTRETPREDPAYRTHRPGDDAYRTQRLLLMLQFTLPGAPHLFYGDEVGLWGADDPDNRKPMLWDDVAYDDEAADVLGRPTPVSRVAPDTGLRAFYHELILLRRAYADLFSAGALEWVTTNDAAGLLVYRRTLEATGGQTQVATVALNLGARPLPVPVSGRDLLRVGGGRDRAVGPRGAVVWIDER